MCCNCCHNVQCPFPTLDELSIFCQFRRWVFFPTKPANKASFKKKAFDTHATCRVSVTRGRIRTWENRNNKEHRPISTWFLSSLTMPCLAIDHRSPLAHRDTPQNICPRSSPGFKQLEDTKSSSAQLTTKILVYICYIPMQIIFPRSKKLPELPKHVWSVHWSAAMYG